MPLALPPSNSHHFEYRSSTECRLNAVTEYQGQGHLKGQNRLAGQGHSLKVIIVAVAYMPLALPPCNSHHFEYRSSTECRLDAVIEYQGQGHSKGQGRSVGKGNKVLRSLWA